MKPRTTRARKEYEQGRRDEAAFERDPIRQLAAGTPRAVIAGEPRR